MGANDNVVIAIGLPVVGSGFGDVCLTSGGTDLLVEFEYRQDHRDVIGGIRFQGVIAYRFSNEMHSRGFVKGSYDTVVEILDSSWKEDLVRNEPSHILGRAADKSHYAVFLRNNGYVETIADSCERVEIREGLLS